MSAPIRRGTGSDASPISQKMNEPKTPVVRRLKPPPEIWELVPVPTEQFKPRQAFVTRLASRWMNLMLLAVVVFAISSVCTAVWKLGTRKSVQPPAAIKVEPARSANVSVGIGETTSWSDESAAAAAAEDADIERTNVSSDDKLITTTSVAGNKTQLRASKRNVSVASPTPETVSSSAREETAAGTRSQVPAIGVKVAAPAISSENKSSGTSTSTSQKPNTSLSPQLIGPANNGPTRKSKVIQWP